MFVELYQNGKVPTLPSGKTRVKNHLGTSYKTYHQPARPQDKQPLRDIEYKIIARLALIQHDLRTQYRVAVM